MSNVRPFTVVTCVLAAFVYEKMHGAHAGEQRDVSTDRTFVAGDPTVFTENVLKVNIGWGITNL